MLQLSSCNSALALEARFVLSGLSWRPRVPLGVRRDLCFQFSSLRSLASLRLPPCGRCFGGLMARNPACYVSRLTLDLRQMCESVFSYCYAGRYSVRQDSEESSSIPGSAKHLLGA